MYGGGLPFEEVAAQQLNERLEKGEAREPRHFYTFGSGLTEATTRHKDLDE
ncbi:hypothetical protein [Paenibacillus sp. oral taxon 786]|uniref:hypothetical protein n=1 Tax=Paenibacillus sp. oral taxon 786 TaxID=652715 RepID=UPI0002E3B0BD|nr:hypothetical protein [Paenibacillus sp. oral taxon 786]